MVVAQQRMERERVRDLTLAWTIEAMHRQKTLPSLRSLLDKSQIATEVQTLEQQRTALYMLSLQYGIPLRKTRLIRRA